MKEKNSQIERMKTDITKLGVDNDNLNIDFQTKLKDIMNGLAQRDQKK